MSGKKKIAVAGAGAIGSVFGGFLAGDGHEVTLIGREERLEAIRSGGLRIEGIWGDRRVSSFNLISGPGQMEDGARFDYVLLSVKTHATRRILEEYSGKLEPRDAIVSLQNGLGNLEVIEEFFPAEKIMGGRVIFGAELVAPGRVRVTVEADRTRVGWCRGGDMRSVREIARVFSDAGIKASATADIHRYLWEKALYSCSLNPLSAALDVPYGELTATEDARSILRKVVEEIFELMRKEKIKISQRNADEYVKKLFGELVPATAAHHSSMLADIRAGRRTEVDSMNGHVVKMGKRHGLKLPVNEGLAMLIHAMGWEGAKVG